MSDRTSDSGLTVWIALRRAHEGGVANLAGRRLDPGRRVPGYVADALDGLTSAGLLALGEVDYEPCGVRRVTVTDSGSVQYVALCQIHKPKGRAGPLRWARCSDGGRLHLLVPAEVVVAVTGGHAETLCGRALQAEDLTLTPHTNGSSEAVCMACVAGIPSDPGPRGTS